MALSTKRPADAAGNRLDPQVIYTCIKSYGADDGGCARGTRLRGDNDKVQRRGQFLAPADLPDDELRALRVALNGGEAWLLG